MSSLKLRTIAYRPVLFPDDIGEQVGDAVKRPTPHGAEAPA